MRHVHFQFQAILIGKRSYFFLRFLKRILLYLESMHVLNVAVSLVGSLKLIRSSTCDIIELFNDTRVARFSLIRSIVIFPQAMCSPSPVISSTPHVNVPQILTSVPGLLTTKTRNNDFHFLFGGTHFFHPNGLVNFVSVLLFIFQI